MGAREINPSPEWRRLPTLHAGPDGLSFCLAGMGEWKDESFEFDALGGLGIDEGRRVFLAAAEPAVQGKWGCGKGEVHFPPRF